MTRSHEGTKRLRRRLRARARGYASDEMRILLVGYGKMGQLVESLAGEYGCEVAGVIDPLSPAHAGRPRRRPLARTSTSRSTSRRRTRCVTNVPALAAPRHQRRHRHDRLAAARGGASRQAVADAGIGDRGRAEFLDRRRAVRGDRRAAPRRCSAPQRDFGAWLHEAHHATKKDAPSGTALSLKRAMEGGRLRAADRRVVDARRLHSRHAHDRVRRPGRDRLR